LARNLQIIFNRYPTIKVFSPPVHVYFFAFEGDTPLSFHRTFSHAVTDANGTRIQILEYDCSPGCRAPHLVGIGYGDTIRKFPLTALETRSPTEVIRETIKASVAADPKHQSSLPVDILYIKKNGAMWIQKKEECPEIQPW
jgi:hypothetical protein